MLVGLSGLCCSLFVGASIYVSSMAQQIAESKEQYASVLPIVQDIKALRAQQGDLAHLSVEDAVWRIIDDLLLEDNLTSIHTTRLNEDEVGIQVTFSSLSLTKLTNFLQALRDRASLQTPDCTLTRNPDDPRLADAHFVFAR